MRTNELLSNTANNATMTSREIAELTGKRHDSVIRTISTLISSAIIQQPQIVEVKNHQGQTVKECVFSGDQGKRDTLVLVARLSPEFTAVIVDRWRELEQKNTGPVIPGNFAAALRLAADQAEEIQRLQITNQHSSMKIDVLEQLLAAGVTAPEFCRRLNGVNTQKINSFLLDAGWLFMTGGRVPRWRVASYARDKYMTEKAFEVAPLGSDPFTVTNPVLLKAGAKRLVDLYMARKLPMKASWCGALKHDLTRVAL